MNKAVLNSLTEQKSELVRETEPAVLRELDEEELLELHARVQRTRTKHVKVYRRGASAAVRDVGARGSSYRRQQRARDGAEIFEAVLSRVSRQLAVVAKRSSDELRADPQHPPCVGTDDGRSQEGRVLPGPRSTTPGGARRTVTLLAKNGHGCHLCATHQDQTVTASTAANSNVPNRAAP